MERTSPSEEEPPFEGGVNTARREDAWVVVSVSRRDPSTNFLPLTTVTGPLALLLLAVVGVGSQSVGETPLRVATPPESPPTWREEKLGEEQNLVEEEDLSAP